MKIKSFEALMGKVKSFEEKCQEDNAKRAAAKLEVEAAQRELNALLDKAETDDSLAGEVGQAQGKLLIAQRKQERLLAQLGESNPTPDLGNIDLSRVQSEIQQGIRDGSLLQDLQPELDALNDLREQYRQKLGIVLNKMERMNGELRDMQVETIRTVESLTDKRQPLGYGFTRISLSDLRPWIWLEYDLHNETSHIMNEARETVSPTPPLPKPLDNNPKPMKIPEGMPNGRYSEPPVLRTNPDGSRSIIYKAYQDYSAAGPNSHITNLNNIE